MSNPLEALDPAFMVPSVGGEVMLNGEIFKVSHIQISNERITDDSGKGRHQLKVHFMGTWDEPGYVEPAKPELY